MIENNPLAVADDLSIDSEYWQWAAKVKPGKSVCFSSSAAYPIKHQRREGYILLAEDLIDFKDDIGMPDMSYGWSKLTLEYLGRLAYERHGLKSVVYRPFSGYGEDQDMTYPFPSISKRVLDNLGAPSIWVWGSGLQMRDFIHIDDCVKGVVKTMDKIDDGEAINLSTGTFTNFRQLAKMMAESAGFSPEITAMSDKPEGVFARGGDTAKQKALGFEHSIRLENGIKRVLNHLDSRPA
jgi:GDP-L-fucose synthase